MDRKIIPSATSAETAERLSDETSCPKRLPTRDALQASVYKLREEIDLRNKRLSEWREAIEDAIAILKKSNDEAEEDAR